jgi:hypothetical protein
MRRDARLALLPLLAGAAATVAAGDDAWLVLTRSAVPPGVEVALDLAAGTTFPESAVALDAEEVLDVRLRLAGRVEPLAAPRATPRMAPRAAPRTLRYRVPLRRPGVATLWASLAPRVLERDSAEVVALLAEIGAPDSVRRAYGAGRRPRRWVERETAHAATYARVSSPLRPAPAADTSWGIATGARLELVAARDPTRLRAGDSVSVRVLRAGRPVFAFPVALVGGGTSVLRRSGAGGVASFRLPRAGRWLLRAAELRRAAPGDDVDWESDRATLAVVAR